MKKILFLIHDLGHGGAEKVLVNLVNHMDKEKFDITVTAVFGGGVNEQFLASHIHYRTVFPKMIPGNSHLMKILSPGQLHKICVHEKYDIEVAYLEGPVARIISGCPYADTKLICWIHCTMHSETEFAVGFRSYQEAIDCFSCFHKKVFVSQEVMSAFETYCSVENGIVLYNTNTSDEILKMAEETIEETLFRADEIKIIGVGKIEEVKGFDRLARIHRRLIREGYLVHTYVLGEGSKKEGIQTYLEEEKLADSFTFLGYQTNPYKFVKNSDIFVCSSYSEGFSTAATEALIVGTPVVTTLVSGMKEMLGENNEWGIITENSDEALYQGIKCLLDDPVLLSYFQQQVAIRGRDFKTEKTVKAVVDMLNQLS